MCNIARGVAYESFMREIRPILDMKAKPYSYTLPKITVYEDGSSEVVYEFSEQTKDFFKLCDELIEKSAQSWGMR